MFVKQPAAIPHHHHAQGRIPSRIGFNELQQPGLQPIAIGRKRNMHRGCIVLHTLPMPLKGEHHSVGDAEGAKYTPAVQQTDLSRRQSLLMRIEDFVVMKEVRVQI